MGSIARLEETTRWVPGNWSSVVTPKGRILMSPGVSPLLLERLWSLLHEDGDTPLPAVLNTILVSYEGDIRSLCDFAVVLNQEDGFVRIAVRGSAIVEADGRTVDSDGATTWSETTIHEPAFLIVRGPEPAAPSVFVAKDAILQVGSMRIGDEPVEGGTASSDLQEDDADPDAARKNGTAPVAKPPVAEPPVVKSPVAEPPRSDAGDHDGRTVAELPDELLAEIRSRVDAPSSSQTDTEGMVLSARCPDGHDNPTTCIECRQCGARLTQPVVKIPQPTLGRMTSSTGDTTELSEPLLIGRAPTLQDGITAHRLISVPSPERMISRNHVLITLEGWSVLAQDLKTNNGTFLRRRGVAPKRLSDTHPTLLRSGDVLDLGDNVLLSFDDLP